jgi:hypothetical protein
MQHHTIDELNDSGVAERAQPSRWSSLRPGRSLLLFPMAVALSWAIVIAVFASIGRLFGPEGEQGTWGEVVGATIGNFVFVFVAAFAVSAIMRFIRSRSG